MKKGQRLRELEAQVGRLEADLKDARERMSVMEKQIFVPTISSQWPAAIPLNPVSPHGPFFTGSPPPQQPVTTCGTSHN